VLDCEAKGISGHAARSEGQNAIIKAIEDISWFNNYQFPRESLFLGPNKMSVTMIGGGVQHNVIPSSCKFTVDIRVNECYTNEEVVEVIARHVSCIVQPRTMRLRSSFIDEQHKLVIAGIKIGKKCFGSATISDKALMPFPTLKMGPGDSARSHTADEFIYVEEIGEGIKTYIALLKEIV
jgi:acetylornithine deacetylase